MSACCTSSDDKKVKINKLPCPECGESGSLVNKHTILHHIKSPWLMELDAALYFFCRNSKCGVVYFSDCNETINIQSLRTKIGIKEQNDEALICFCFGVNKSVAATDKSVKEFVVAQTKNAVCACETANPSGRCCLKDFPKI